MGSFRPSLLERAAAAATAAQAQGALQPIRTRVRVVADGGLRFQLRIVDSLGHKPAAGGGDPFLRYDPALWVADVAPAHRVLLNKYPVLDGHLLLVTREFQPQTAPLTPADFAALAGCLAEFDALAFYNAGQLAGASQPHRHLQLIPRRPQNHALPVEALLSEGVSALAGCAVASIPALPFAHAARRMPALDGHRLHAAYRELLAAIGRDPDAAQAPAYNLLVTRDWMLAVPREREGFAGVSVNALAFAGLLLAANAAQARTLEAISPSAVLRQASGR